MLQAIGWLAATIFFVFIEASTFNLVSVWFAVGGAAALVSCIFTGSLRVQSAVFVAVSILCLLALRPLTARLRRPLTPTNGDLNVGRTATILTPVTDDAPGRARLDGVDWNAQAVPGASFAPGDKCRVAAIRSTTLIVEPAPIETPVRPN
ncbi:MAG TPA: NfeD family protein [Candidatus Faecalibacterium intestinigallinarum]|uniref:NfeD family protein n=1 Tax=Candidatus Faecalibacterium intestinigallinarum TaxID=2838581 RepID=A0A9D1QBA3_9FIRM|nr:NfeD family protein [Candidatus Faecalibacterium intestinigallinarum]